MVKQKSYWAGVVNLVATHYNKYMRSKRLFSSTITKNARSQVFKIKGVYKPKQVKSLTPKMYPHKGHSSNLGYTIKVLETHQLKKENTRKQKTELEQKQTPAHIETDFLMVTVIFLTWYNTFQEKVVG